MDEEFLKQIYRHTQIKPMTENNEVPERIQQYRQIVQANNEISIFDQNYDVDSEEPSGASAAESKFFNDQSHLIYVVPGRGRGGRNIFIKPGDNIGVSDDDDDEIRRQIRKIHGIGYGNSITEESIRAHQMAEENKKIHSQTVQSSIDYESESTKAASSVTVEGKPLPLSVMLKQSREDYKKRRMEKLQKEKEQATNVHRVSSRYREKSPKSPTQTPVSPKSNSSSSNLSYDKEYPPLR